MIYMNIGIEIERNEALIINVNFFIVFVII